ncbi:hypothetical protein AN219_33615, partial [Streptomyces nanshensis]
MSSRRDHPTHATGAHRAHSVRRPKRHQSSGRSKVFSRAGAPPDDAVNGTGRSATSAVADGTDGGTSGTARTAGATAGTIPSPA